MAPELFEGCTQKELENIRKLIQHFEIPTGNITKVELNSNGRLNRTIIVSYHTEDGFKKLVLQKVNTGVFKRPYGLMENISSVTNFIIENGGQTLHFYKVRNEDSTLYYNEEDCSHWRLYDFKEADVKNSVTSAKDTYNLGKAIGEFSKCLTRFDATKLNETIPNFHNTKKRYSGFVTTVSDPTHAKRCNACMEEIDFILARGDKKGLIVDALQKGEIPMRVSHNDPKLNNVLFDKYTGEVMCLIDLDTIMPGTILYDFGDACRYACNTESEEATSVENVSFNMEYFKALAEGLLQSMKDVITEIEVSMLASSAWVLTYELCIRFLDDHIDGNNYFGVPYDGKNLERARVQIALLKDIEAKQKEMEGIVSEIWNEVKK